MNQMLSRMNQTTTLAKRQGRSSTPALTLWVSPLSIYMVFVTQHSWASTAKNNLDRAVEVLKTLLSDAYVVSTDQLASSESVKASFHQIFVFTNAIFTNFLFFHQMIALQKL